MTKLLKQWGELRERALEDKDILVRAELNYFEPMPDELVEQEIEQLRFELYDNNQTK